VLSELPCKWCVSLTVEVAWLFCNFNEKSRAPRIGGPALCEGCFNYFTVHLNRKVGRYTGHFPPITNDHVSADYGASSPGSQVCRRQKPVLYKTIDGVGTQFLLRDFERCSHFLARLDGRFCAKSCSKCLKIDTTTLPEKANNIQAATSLQTEIQTGVGFVGVMKRNRKKIIEMRKVFVPNGSSTSLGWSSNTHSLRRFNISKIGRRCRFNKYFQMCDTYIYSTPEFSSGAYSC